MSEMSDFFKRMGETQEDEPTTDDEVASQCGPGTPLEQAVEKAIYSLKEIKYYAELGRARGCLDEATDALTLIEILMDQHRNSAEDEVVEVDANE